MSLPSTTQAARTRSFPLSLVASERTRLACCSTSAYRLSGSSRLGCCGAPFPSLIHVRHSFARIGSRLTSHLHRIHATRSPASGDVDQIHLPVSAGLGTRTDCSSHRLLHRLLQLLTQTAPVRYHSALCRLFDPATIALASSAAARHRRSGPQDSPCACRFKLPPSRRWPLGRCRLRACPHAAERLDGLAAGAFDSSSSWSRATPASCDSDERAVAATPTSVQSATSPANLWSASTSASLWSASTSASSLLAASTRRAW